MLHVNILAGQFCLICLGSLLVASMETACDATRSLSCYFVALFIVRAVLVIQCAALTLLTQCTLFNE